MRHTLEIMRRTVRLVSSFIAKMLSVQLGADYTGPRSVILVFVVFQ